MRMVTIARVRADGGSTMVIGAGEGPAVTATVDGVEFGDLPELLVATEGDWSRIVPGRGLGTIAADDVLSVVGSPAKIVCVGLNYQTHVAEGSRTAAPRWPELFVKWPSSLTAPFASLAVPPESPQLDWESELAVIIGRRCRRIDAGQAADVIAGYTVANDVTLRDYQSHATQWLPGKAWDGLTPLGPTLVPAHLCGGSAPDLAITGLLNGEVMQSARTSELIFSIAELIAYTSTFVELVPGDVLLTGTPAGIGARQQPARFLTPGDVFEVRIDGIGALRSVITAAPRQQEQAC